MLPQIDPNRRIPKLGHRHAVGQEIVDRLDVKGLLDFRVWRNEKMQKNEQRDENQGEQRN